MAIPMDDQPFFRVYEAISALISLLSITIYVVGAVTVFSTGQPSSGK